MLGAFRGMPARLAIVFGLVSACSQDPQFIERDMTPGSAASDDLIVDFCSTAVAADESMKDKCFSLESQLAIEPATVGLNVGESVKFSAYLILKDGSKLDVSSDAEWSVADARLLSVGSEKGIVRGLAGGASLLEARFSRLSASAEVNVRSEVIPRFPRVAIKIQGRDEDTQRVPVGMNAAISWESADVDHCRLLVRGAEYDRRLSGSLAVKIQGSGPVEVICQSNDGTEVADQIEVIVTQPKVILTVNDSIDDVTLGAAGPIKIAWSSTDAESCDVFVSGSKLRGQASPSGTLMATFQRSGNVEALCRDIAGNTDRAIIDVKLEYQRRISFSPGYYDVISGNRTRRPVSIMFALDVTGSMGGQIQTVKTGVQDFVTQLHARGFEPRIGVVPFRDSVPETGPTTEVPEGRLELTANVEEVTKFVSGLRASNGGDANEASLAAIRSAMSSLRLNETRPDAIKIIMVVTDQAGHDGTLRNCVIDPVVNQFAGLSPEEQKNFKLFYSTPSIGTACSGYADGSQQMSALLSRILTAEELVTSRGGLIPWPFANTNLVNDVVTLLEKVNPDIELACLNTSATLSIAGSVQFVEELKDLNGSFRQLEAGGNQSIARTLTAEQFEALNAGEGSLLVRQCCFSKAAARAGVFSSCLKPAADRTVPFAVE